MRKNKSLVKTGDLILLKPFEKCNIYFNNKSGDNSKIYIVSFHQTLFNKTDGEEDFLRAFNERKMGNNNIYRCSEFKGFDVYTSVIYQLEKYTKYNLSLFHFKAPIVMLITQLTFVFDEKNNYFPVKYSSDYKIKIYDYITRNYCNNITISEIEEKFSVSRTYINSVTKKFYGYTFRETVKQMRLWDAKKMMKNHEKLSRISDLCGFSSYSGFYRAYTKFFGINPKDDYNLFLKTGSFFKD